MLSILIPSYNHAAYVAEAIASARRITVTGRRIVVVDDASTDDSVAVIERCIREAHGDAIELIRKPVNRGAVDSVNLFLSCCDSEYVYFMASDDVAIAKGIDSLVGLLRARTGLQFVMGGGRNVLPDGTTTPVYGRKHDALFALPPQELVRSLFLVDASPLLCQGSVFRLSAIRAVDGFDPTVVADDYALFTRLFRRFNRRGIDFEFAPDIDCVRYRHHGSNSYRNLPRQAQTHRQVIEVTAPASLRDRAAGYKLAFFALVALRRRDFDSLRTIVRMARPAELPWLAVGLVSNTVDWLKVR